ncbi:hypothetical protein [Methylacidiphilum kamchatkense]|uniref:hypothetical protein n=1 Tax=Methylacidiphilum kamchatkense TaxID=431057 RepID=UPI000AB61ABD|nr:hypothetical protein [Methylacidiphilum kamchatkense]
MLVAAPFGYFFAGYILRLVKRKTKERKEATTGLEHPFSPLFYCVRPMKEKKVL